MIQRVESSARAGPGFTFLKESQLFAKEDRIPA
jgi:hypothetical protein